MFPRNNRILLPTFIMNVGKTDVSGLKIHVLTFKQVYKYQHNISEESGVCQKIQNRPKFRTIP